MEREIIPEGFWKDNISKSNGKHNTDPEAWELICQIRNSPIKLIRDVIQGHPNKPHEVLPEGLKGYLIDDVEAFCEVYRLSDANVELILSTDRFDSYNGIPAVILDYEKIAVLRDGDYEIVEPFFDMMLADYAERNMKFS